MTSPGRSPMVNASITKASSSVPRTVSTNPLARSKVSERRAFLPVASGGRWARRATLRATRPRRLGFVEGRAEDHLDPVQRRLRQRLLPATAALSGRRPRVRGWPYPSVALRTR